MRAFVFRVHEWMADRLPWMQYPQRVAPGAPYFARAMPWWLRIGLVAIGLGLIVVGALAMGFMGLVLWAIFSG